MERALVGLDIKANTANFALMATVMVNNHSYSTAGSTLGHHAAVSSAGGIGRRLLCAVAAEVIVVLPHHNELMAPPPVAQILRFLLHVDPIRLPIATKNTPVGTQRATRAADHSSEMPWSGDITDQGRQNARDLAQKAPYRWEQSK